MVDICSGYQRLSIVVAPLTETESEIVWNIFLEWPEQGHFLIAENRRGLLVRFEQRLCRQVCVWFCAKSPMLVLTKSGLETRIARKSQIENRERAARVASDEPTYGDEPLKSA